MTVPSTPAGTSPPPVSPCTSVAPHTLQEAKDQVQHDEVSLDTAVEDSFPASDPVAEVAVTALSLKITDAEDELLDEAIEMTFPASDPISVGHITRLVQIDAGVVETGKPAH